MDKKSTYKGYTQAHNEAHKRYMRGYVEIRARVTQEQRDAIQAHAENRGESVNGFIQRAIREAIERDKEEKQ